MCSCVLVRACLRACHCTFPASVCTKTTQTRSKRIVCCAHLIAGPFRNKCPLTCACHLYVCRRLPARPPARPPLLLACIQARESELRWRAEQAEGELARHRRRLDDVEESSRELAALAGDLEADLSAVREKRSSLAAEAYLSKHDLER